MNSVFMNHHWKFFGCFLNENEGYGGNTNVGKNNSRKESL